MGTAVTRGDGGDHQWDCPPSCLGLFSAALQPRVLRGQGSSLRSSSRCHHRSGFLLRPCCGSCALRGQLEAGTGSNTRFGGGSSSSSSTLAATGSLSGSRGPACRGLGRGKAPAAGGHRDLRLATAAVLTASAAASGVGARGSTTQAAVVLLQVRHGGARSRLPVIIFLAPRRVPEATSHNAGFTADRDLPATPGPVVAPPVR